MLGSTVAAAATVAPRFVHASVKETLKVGLIGCGGRGTGAAMDCANADPSVEIWAMGDLFPDRLNGSRNQLRDNLKERYKVADDHAFSGWDAFEKVAKTDVDIIILATPPGFRPAHLAAAIAAGKHVFMEKPVAVDAPGIHSVYESADSATKKGLCIVAGTQRRHDLAYRECMNRIHDGQMGDVVASYAYWNQGGLWMNPRQPNWTDMEWQLRNWLYFSWLSGDHIVEQHVHNIDVCNWAMNAHPVKAISLAGRQCRTDPAYGHIFDHFATEFEYANGAKMISMCRQIDGTASRVSESIIGTKGTSNANTRIVGEKAWRYEGERPNPYVQEHRHLIEAIKSGKPINEGRQVADATFTAILGRMAAYTGLEVTWDQGLASKEVLAPKVLQFGEVPVAEVAHPGQTKLI